MTDHRITIVVVDDHEMILESVVRRLDLEPDMQVLAVASTVAEGLAATGNLRPNIVVMDYRLPDGDGATAALHIREQWPTTRVVMLTGSGAQGAVFEASRAGCAGYVEKTKAFIELVEVIRRVARGAEEFPQEDLEQLPTVSDLAVHYQPIIDLTTAAIVGFEALVRWLHPTRGLVFPGEFIELAEQTNVICDIDQEVRRQACAQAVEWDLRFPTDPPRFMSVNLSGRELRQPDLIERMDSVLDETGLDPNAVVVEITETFLVDQTEEHTRRLEKLKGLGVRIALDDFGTAYSSLAYLRRFPIDIIKLDKSFVDELPGSTRGLHFIEALLHLARDMDVLVEAEGIETHAQAECLRSRGCSFGQGYLFSRAEDVETVDLSLARIAVCS